MIATTARRVSSNTHPEINARIWHHTEEHMREVAAAGRGAIEKRLRELDEEWDIECMWRRFAKFHPARFDARFDP